MENFYYNTSILYWARHLDLKKKKNLTKTLDKNSDTKQNNKLARLSYHNGV